MGVVVRKRVGIWEGYGEGGFSLGNRGITTISALLAPSRKYTNSYKQIQAKTNYGIKLQLVQDFLPACKDAAGRLPAVVYGP